MKRRSSSSATSRKQAAKDRILKGFDGLAEKIGAKKSITGDERTSLIEDIKNIVGGITDLTAEEIKDMVKNFLSKYKDKKELMVGP